MIRSLREIDPSGVILSLIVPPIRSYLRGRKDTITVIVSGLIGTGESTLLRQELETPVNNNSKGGQSSVGILESEENVSRSAGIKNLEEYDSDYDDDDFENGIKPDWDDENWFPRPIDAGPNYNQSKNEDIINILITIFDDRLGFIKALEQTTAESLIKVRNYDSTREVSLSLRSSLEKLPIAAKRLSNFIQFFPFSLSFSPFPSTETTSS